MNTLSRRGFVNHLGVGALTTAFAVGQSSSVQGKDVPSSSLATNADEWLNGVKGTHRIVYDAPEPHNGFPVIWTWVFYQTNNQTGSNGGIGTEGIETFGLFWYAIKEKTSKSFRFRGFDSV
jgi:hypothetical protein